jgi:predicted RNase H-like HicB family nuclease
MKDTYIYPAVFSYADDGISVEFPDLPGCLPLGYTTEEAVKSARSCLSLHIYGMECDGEEIPEPSDVRQIHHGENEAVMLVEAFMPPFRAKMAGRFIKKNIVNPSLAERGSGARRDKLLRRIARRAKETTAHCRAIAALSSARVKATIVFSFFLDYSAFRRFAGHSRGRPYRQGATHILRRPLPFKPRRASGRAPALPSFCRFNNFTFFRRLFAFTLFYVQNPV